MSGNPFILGTDTTSLTNLVMQRSSLANERTNNHTCYPLKQVKQ